MEKRVKVKFGRVVPSLALLAVIALLAGLSFIPALRSAPTAAGGAVELDTDAVRVLNTCRAYASDHAFSTRISGAVKAKVLGIPYTQHIDGSREVCGDEFCEVAESASSFVKAAVRKECAHGDYAVCRGDYEKKSFVYGEPRAMSRDEYVDAYGMPNTGIVKYNLDGAIVGATCVSENEFRFVLDATAATEYSRNEVRTTLGASDYPNYESVEFTLYTDGNRAIKIVAQEAFSIKKFGGTRCTAEYTEVFDYD
ncbi:MAG: hypothetical protein NC184_07600 [Roseburia sp.]|nr:hypothetical protein [Roseburia sp.]